MSIILVDKKSLTSKQITINSEFLNTQIFKKFASTELNCTPSELRLFHVGIDKQYGENQIVKQGDKMEYQIQYKNEIISSTQSRKTGIVYPDQLQKIIQNSKIILIKSANQENIQKSKDHSLWATTFSNQQRLKYFFHNFPNVILIFATNRSYQIKGLARMESQPDRIIDKSVWSGVSHIRLGGNFKIKWLRKKPLSFIVIEKILGNNFKESLVKSCDGQQMDPIHCKKLVNLFETPDQPYYIPDEKNQSGSSKIFEKLNVGKQPTLNLSSLNQFRFPSILQTQFFQKKDQKFQVSRREQSQPSSDNSSKKDKKIKKQKSKQKKKHYKNKKSQKKHKSSSSDSARSSSKSSDSSSHSRGKKKIHKKERRHKKHKKQKKHYS